MKQKKIPLRTCVITKEKCEKKDLIRICRTPEGKIIIDETGKANGRGAYLKKDLAVIEKAQKSNTLTQILGVNVEKEIFEALKNIINR